MEIAGSRAVPWARRWSDRRSNGEDPTGRQRMRSTPVLNDREAPQFQGAAGPSVGFARRAGAFVLHEFLEMLPPTIFFFVGFNLIVLTTNLILADYSVALGSFMLVTGAALVVGKSVLVANAMARLLEHLIRFWLVEHNPVREFLPHMVSTFSWHRFAAIQIWILVLFLIYVTATEFNHLCGDGELGRIVFTHRASELQLN